MRIARTGTLLLALLPLACAAERSTEGTVTPAPAAPLRVPAGLPERFTGYYEYGFEKQAFRPCGTGEAWWAWRAPRELQRSFGQRSFVVLQGYVSPEGSYGHLGLYPRQIEITGLIRVEPATEEDQCPAPDSVAPARSLRAGEKGSERGSRGMR